jgi:hypothetical protein
MLLHQNNCLRDQDIAFLKTGASAARATIADRAAYDEDKTKDLEISDKWPKSDEWGHW